MNDKLLMDKDVTVNTEILVIENPTSQGLNPLDTKNSRVKRTHTIEV